MGDPLRILHVVVNMNRGGAETLIMNLYRNMDRTKIQFDFLTCKAGAFDKEIIEMGGKVHRIPYVTEAGHNGFIRAWKHFLKTNQAYRIVHSHMDKMSGFVLKAAREVNVPVRIAHSHNTESEGGFASRTYKWYAGNQVKANATHFYACSHAAAKWLFREKHQQAFILKNGIEPDEFQFSQHTRDTIRNKLKLDKDTLVIGHVGRFSPQKNHLFLLDVFAALIKRVPNSYLLLTGGGPLKPKIVERIKELKLEEKVKLLGIRDDIPILLQAFDRFIFPSLHEGLPVTLIEAQGAGLPCIISDTITKEVDMGIGLVKQLSLADKKSWIESIIKPKKDKQSRIIAHDALSLQGYDIRKTAALTQTSYLSLGESVL